MRRRLCFCLDEVLDVLSLFQHLQVIVQLLSTRQRCVKTRRTPTSVHVRHVSWFGKTEFPPGGAPAEKNQELKFISLLSVNYISIISFLVMSSAPLFSE